MGAVLFSESRPSAKFSQKGNTVLQRLASLVFLILPWSFYAQTSSIRPADIKGHFMGESIGELLSKEPDVRQKFVACEQKRADNLPCKGLLAAVRQGQRASVSTSSWTTFVLDGGELVKMTTLVNGASDAVTADLTNKFGPPTSETAFPMRNAMGTNWVDHLSVWETPVVYVGLHEDNNPASQNHHLVLVVESRAELAREHADGPQ
jgi:hypothetical protein